MATEITEEDVRNKLELKEELLDLIEMSNPNRAKLEGWVEALKWVLSKGSYENETEEEEESDTRRFKSKTKGKHLIAPDSVLGKMLNK